MLQQQETVALDAQNKQLIEEIESKEESNKVEAVPSEIETQVQEQGQEGERKAPKEEQEPKEVAEAEEKEKRKRKS